MLHKCFLVSVIYLICQGAVKTHSPLKEKIYFSLNENEFHMCFRRFNETHQVGCGSKKNGNVGILYVLENNDDLEVFKTFNEKKFIVLMTMRHFSRAIVEQLIATKRVAGVLIGYENSTARPFGFSPDLKIPNQRYSYHDRTVPPWNPFGDGLLFLNIPFPVALLTNSTTIEFLKKCHQVHNTEGLEGCPWCSVRMKSFMHGAVSSVVCHRRSSMQSNFSPDVLCDPIGGYNILGSLQQWRPEKVKTDSVILIVARTDALSMFDGITPGLDSATTGFVALHVIAKMLGKMKNRIEHFLEQTPVMFALFQGESLDYLGSSRFVYDMNKGSFTYFNLSSVGVIIELGQLGLHRYDVDVRKVYVHHELGGDQEEMAKIEKVLRALRTWTGDIEVADRGGDIPPSSIHSFLKKKLKIAGFYITNHASAFTNRFYNSFLDDKYNVDIFNSSEGARNEITTVAQVEEVAFLVACGVYNLVSNNSDCVDVIQRETNYTKDLFYCFTEDADCELFNSTVFEDEELAHSKESFKSRYVGVFSENSRPQSTVAHRALLVQSLGSRVDLTMCHDQESRYVNNTIFLRFKGAIDKRTGKRDPVCYKAFVVLSAGVPPVFEKQDLLTESEFPAWTESRWQTLSIDVFLLPCKDQEIKTIVLGLVVSGAFIPIVLFINFRLLAAPA